MNETFVAVAVTVVVVVVVAAVVVVLMGRLRDRQVSIRANREELVYN